MTYRTVVHAQDATATTDAPFSTGATATTDAPFSKGAYCPRRLAIVWAASGDRILFESSMKVHPDENVTGQQHLDPGWS